MSVTLRIMRLADLKPGVRVEYERRDGSIHNAIIVSEDKGIRARTEQPDGSLSPEHPLFATSINRIIAGAASAPGTEGTAS